MVITGGGGPYAGSGVVCGGGGGGGGAVVDGGGGGGCRGVVCGGGGAYTGGSSRTSGGAPIALTVAVPEVLGLPGGLNKKRHCKPIEINQPYVHYGTHDYNEPHVCTLSHL